MEGHIYNSNSNMECEYDSSTPFQSNTNFLNSNYTIQISGSPISSNNYFQSLLEDDPNQRSAEKNHEFMVQYDIYGNSINRTLLSSPLPRYSNSRSYELGRGTFNTIESPTQEMEIIDPEITEWDLEKENIDPKGALTTPYKSRRTHNGISNSNTRVSTSGRSPLQDITPSMEKRKSVAKNSGIEVKILFRFLMYLNVTIAYAPV